ncbi:PAS domain S-box-containing protein [Methanohalophilus levihalophilus]|uniref:PAS domain-containing sensor histidine kinase n=1 Tax=Methanohalophilus levihalophilus TaxID=1431282 RepID=UPI001AEB0C7D|nr:ATP-binding protein [Methanohalophilus levihalophilus]MBP2030430.1 PAS domain S-box-containing protein [Methanohalophilus levihalophilus]
MPEKNIDDPLRLKGFFSRPYSVLTATVIFFLLLMVPFWLYFSVWLEDLLVNGLSPDDLPLIKAVSFMLVILAANLFYMSLRNQVDLEKTIKQQDTQIQFNEERFMHLIDAVPDVAVQGFDSEGTINYWNRASEKMFGYSIEDAIGSKLTELIILPEYRENFDRIIRSSSTVFVPIEGSEISFLKKDGGKISVYSSHVALTDPEGSLEFFSMEIDLSERKNLENELLKAKVIAEASSRSKSEFLANMSHELRTPLNAIIGFSDFLLTKKVGELNEKQEKYLTNVHDSGLHLLNIINNILDISKAESGKHEIHYDTFNVRQTLHDIVEIIDPLAFKKGLSIDVSVDENVDVMVADEEKIKQILYNLLGNAIKFSHVEDVLKVRVEKLDSGFIKFEIEDHGIGIKPEDQKKLFKTFSQVESSASRRYGGTGLGLSLVKKFVEMHGGKVYIDSKFGEYTIFGFCLPEGPDK